MQRDPIRSSQLKEDSPIVVEAIKVAARELTDRFGPFAAGADQLYEYADGANTYLPFSGNPVINADPSGLKVVIDGPFATYNNSGQPVYRYHYYDEGWFSTTFMYSKDYPRIEGNSNNIYDQDIDCACRGQAAFAAVGTQSGLNSGGATGLGPTGEGLLMAGVLPAVFKTPHIMRHFTGTGITQEALEAAISADLAGRTCKAGFNQFEITVEGRQVIYRSYKLPNGTINIGTAFPKN